VRNTRPRGESMSFLRKLFKPKGDQVEDDTPIALDAAARAPQLLRLEQALDALATAMRHQEAFNNPGWRGRVSEYSMLAGEVMKLRRGPLTREALLDVVFAVRPLFHGPIPPGLESLVPLQTEVLEAAESCRQRLPGEPG
jgi:hypothetical protein